MVKNFKIDGSLETTGSLVTQGKEVATREWVEGVVAGKIDYLGIFNSSADLISPIAMSATAGDYARCGTAFEIGKVTAAGMEYEQVHVGDLIVKHGTGSSNSASNWDIIHTEDPGNYVTLDTDQTITGEKTFENKIQIRSAAGEPERHTYLGLESLTFTSFNMDSFDSYITFWDNVKDREYNLKLPDLPDSVMPGNDLTEVIATQEWVKTNTSSTIDQDFFNSLYQ
jgi:hypothetical protein